MFYLAEYIWRETYYLGTGSPCRLRTDCGICNIIRAKAAARYKLLP